MEIAIEFCMFELVFVSNFTLKNFEFFHQIYSRRIFMVKNRKIENHHGILQIRIGLITRFQFQLIILSVWTKFTQKGYFHSKTEQAVQRLQAFVFCVVNVNSRVVFENSEDLENLIILIILKEELVMFCLLGFFYLKIV